MELDRLDIEILRSLQADARLSYRDLSKRLGVSVPTVSAHVHTLEQLGILRGYHADIDPGRLQESTVVLVVRCTPPATAEVAEALAAIPEMRGVQRARGPRVLAVAVVREGQDIDSLLDRISRVANVVDYEHYVVTSVAKYEPLAIVTEGLSTTLICFQCKGPIHGEPIKLRMDGRDHYLCCNSCERLYLEKYTKLKAAAGRR